MKKKKGKRTETRGGGKEWGGEGEEGEERRERGRGEKRGGKLRGV